MRLETIRATLKRAAPRLEVKAAIMEPNVRIDRVGETIAAVREVRETGLFQDLTKAILGIEPIALAVGESIVVPQNLFNAFNSKLGDLRLRALIVLHALDEHLGELPDECFAIRLPETSDLEATAKLLQEINKLLDQVVVNDYVNGKVTLERVESGSIWLFVCVGTFAAFKLVAGMIRFYFECKQRAAHQLVTEQALKDVALDAETRSKLRAALNSEIDAFRAARMKQVLSESEIPENDHEFVRRLENASRVLGGLLERGLEIHPVLTAPVEQRELVPDPKQILETIKLLPVSSSDGEDR